MVSGMFQVQVVIISKFFFLCRCQRQISLYLQYSQPPHSSSPQRADRGPFRLWVLADPAVPADRECCRPWAPSLPSRPWCRDTLPKRMWKWDEKKKQVMKTIALAADICTVGHIRRSGMDSGGYALTSLVRVLRLSRGLHSTGVEDVCRLRRGRGKNSLGLKCKPLSIFIDFPDINL